MFESSLEYLHCVNCNNKPLKLDVLKKEGSEIVEGFIVCKKCLIKYPIIKKVPILWSDFTSYLITRPSLGGLFLTRYAETQEVRSFIKKSLNKINKHVEDRYKIEKRWVEIYENSKNSSFYSFLKSYLQKLPKQKLVIEHGCSIGLITNYVSKFSEIVFGIDTSFSAILTAKKNQGKKTEYLVTDSIFHPFGSQLFDLVIGLNILDIIEPRDLLSVLSYQTKKNGFLVLSDPYDYKRGAPFVRKPITETNLRNHLRSLGFGIRFGTQKPSFLKWSLNLNRRAKLEYKSDVVIGKKLR
ncbi:MAG: methyltransferase domain-containing protein [Nitrosopumilaceae archaeon]|nr:class I SAM-dependent methyltransferase [Nitrosopumilaceae archaeon]NIT99443.1 class I SAM-dependent methyltransferase [Nitrosopumilaceae archaeon]NIU85802.1 methyltransferase domain-containing protein [Nitrosopumilaceae archaeon]NIV64659.1 methyltransferase domain-containing protein [Nitrosopumilaceae archaeon]NIX60046.1 methyltransferase domain-containing protein [Nitrosopumilaceae archaeon]